VHATWLFFHQWKVMCLNKLMLKEDFPVTQILIHLN